VNPVPNTSCKSQRRKERRREGGEEKGARLRRGEGRRKVREVSICLEKN
jgi:hypothetical protein